MKNIKSRRSASIVYKPSVLVAGGAGFVGSFLCQSLLLQGCRVLAVDNLVTGKKENIKSCFENPDFSFIKHDLCRSLKKISRADYIFYLAGAGNSRGIKNVLEFAKETGAKFLLVSFLQSLKNRRTARRFAEELTLEYFRQGVDTRIVRLDWIYGPRMNLASEGALVKFFKTVLSGPFVTIPGTGKQEIYPTFISDVIYGLTKAMFTTQTSGEVFTLIGSEKISFLNLVQKVKGILKKDFKIKFVAGSEEEAKDESRIKASQRILGWKAKIKIEEGARRTLSFFSTVQKKPFQKQVEKKTLSFFNRVFIVILVLTFFVCLPFSFPLGHVFFGGRDLKSAWQNLKLGKVDRCQKSAFASLSNFEKAGREINWLNQILTALGIEEKMQPHMETTRLAQKIARLAVHGSEAAGKMEEINKIILKSGSGDLTLLVQETKIILETIQRELSFLEAELNRKEFLFSRLKFLKFLPEFSELKKALPQERRKLADLLSVFPILPDLTGMKEKKTYLVLFQNNMELRPTGGFIGSFALVSFEKGRMLEFEVFDVYSADGQLKGHVEPPRPLKEYLGEGGWYLRDSNWNPSFPSSAIKAQWFLDKTLGLSVDGVIAINLNLAQSLLQSVEEVELIDFKEKINSDNLFKKAQVYSESGFFPGSTQKKDFLGSLSQALLEKVKNTSSVQQLKVIQAIYSSLETKEVMIYLNNHDLMKKVVSLGWEGSLRQSSCLDSDVSCVKDYLMLVEANLGVNKANFYVKRNLALQVAVDQEGQIENMLKIDYLNGSQTDSPFGGVYKNYLRLFVPLGSVLNQIKIGGVILKDQKIDSGIANEKTYFGFLIEVPAGEKTKVEVSYQLPFEIRKDQETDYLFLWQRQSGSDKSRLFLKADFPEKTSVLKINPLPKKTGKEIEFEKRLDRDLLFQVRVKL